MVEDVVVDGPGKYYMLASITDLHNDQYAQSKYKLSVHVVRYRNKVISINQSSI